MSKWSDFHQHMFAPTPNAIKRHYKVLKGFIDPEPKPNAAVDIEKEGTNQSVPIIYGEINKASCIKIFKTVTDKTGGADNEYLHLICVFCVGEIEEIGQLYFNDIHEGQIDNERYFIKRYTGSENQTYCSELAAEFSQWKTTAKLKNVAYAYVRLQQNQMVDWWKGEPKITANIKGLKVLDPRDSVIKYSENAALCTYDYLTNSDYGKGLSINKMDVASFITAADFIETLSTYTKTVYKTWFDREERVWRKVPVGTENETITTNLMSCNVGLDSDETIKKNVETLLSGMRAILPETNGKYRIAIEKDDSAVFAFTKDNLIGSIQSKGGSQSDRYNQVIIRYRNNLTGSTDEVVYPEDDNLHQQWLAEDRGKLLLGELDFNTISNKAEALQMAHVIAHRSRNLIGAMFTGFPETIVVEAGDVVTLDSVIFGWNAKPFRIEAVDIDLKTGAVAFQAVEHQNSIYPWAVNDVTEEFVDTSFALPNTIPTPTNLAFTAINNDNLKQGKLTWDDSNNALVSAYVIETLDSNNQVINTQESIDNFIDIFGLPSGDFTFRVSAANSLYRSVAITLALSLTRTTIGWETVVGFDFDDIRISNAAITGFVTDELYASEKAVLQAQIDKSITTWFLTGTPTLANAPANTWASNADKNIHLGDLYYDNATGYAYRFMINASVYSWNKVSDSDVTKALADAATAQDTADSKRRVFVEQPVAPYDIGDLWDTGSGINRATAAKAIGGNYAGGDWVLVSDTTDYDDNRVSNDAINVGGINLFEDSANIEVDRTTSEHGYFASIEHVMNKLDIGDEVTISFDVKQLDNGSNGQYLQCYFHNQSAGKSLGSKIFYNVGTTWERLSLTTVVVAGSNNAAETWIEFYSVYGTGDFWHVKNLKIERGNKATDWSKAPEDLQADIVAAENRANAAADAAALAKANLAETRAKAHADDKITIEEARAIADATNKANDAKAAAISSADQLARLRNSDHTLYDMNAVAPHISNAGAPSPVGYSRTSALNVYSDYIPVRKGETLHWEMWAKQTGSTVRAYMGISRYDRNKKPIAGNNANVYGGMSNTVLSTVWKKYTASHTLPTSHTPYNGSDGNEVCFVKVVILMNYQTTGQAYYSGYRLFRVPDQQYMPNLVAAGAGTALNLNPLSASDNGSTAKITVAAHTRQYGFGSLSLNAGSITGLSFSTKYYVYYDDPSYAGGAVSYKATTNIQGVAAGNHRIYVSVITTPANGGGATIPPDIACVTLDMWLTHVLHAKAAVQGDELDLWWQGENAVKGEVLQAELIEHKQVIYQIETSSGAIVRISESTPLELQDHTIITPKELMVNQDKLATLKDDSSLLYWETVINCKIIGEQPVMHISVGNGSFAAGLDANNRIITHNAQLKP